MSFSRWFQQNKKLVGISGAATTVGAGLWWYERRHLKDTEPAILQKGLHKQEFGSQVADDFDKGEKISSGESNKPEGDDTKQPTKSYQDAIESEIRKLSLSPELAGKVREYIEKEVYVTSEDDLPIASKMLADRDEGIAYHAKRSVDHATNKIANEASQRTKSIVTEGMKEKAHGLKESLIDEKEKLKTMVKNKKPLEQLKGKRDQLVGAVETRAKDILGYTSPPTENNSQETTNNIPLPQSQIGIKEELTDLNLESGQAQGVPHDVLGRRITEQNRRIDFIEENIPASQTFTDAVKSAKDKVKDLEHKVEGDLAQGKEYLTEKAKEARNVLDEKIHKLSGGVNELGNKLDVEHNIKVDIIEYHGEDIPEIVKRKAKELTNATIKTVSTTQEKFGELTQEMKETAVEPIVNKYNESKESLLEKAKEAKDQAVKEKEFNEKLYGSKKEQVERFAEEVKHEVKETADNTRKKMEELAEHTAQVAVKKLKNTALSTVHVAQEATDKITPVLSKYERFKEYMYQRAKNARDTAAALKHERLQKEARHTTEEKGDVFDSSATVDEVINNP